MAARVSSSSRPAHSHHHPLSHQTAATHPSILNNPPIARSPSLSPSLSPSSSSPSSSSFSTTSSSPSPGSVFDPVEPSPSTFSLAASDASRRDHSHPRGCSSPSTVNTSLWSSTPAASPVLPHSLLEPVAESASSAASALLNHSRLHQPQPQPPPQPQYQHKHQHQHQQLGANSARGDLKSQRAGGFFAFAASALERTQSAISPTSIRHKRSSSRLSISGDATAPFRTVEPSPNNTSRHRPASVVPPSPSASSFSAQSPAYKTSSSQYSLPQEPIFSQPYTETDPSQPAPVLLPRVDNKMHQTSSRLLRMTDDDRPFTKVSHLSIMICFGCAGAPSYSAAFVSSSKAALCAGMWRQRISTDQSINYHMPTPQY